MNPAGLIRLFVRHRNAGNLLMLLAVAAGLFSLSRLNTQFFPEFDIDVISITVAWSGASAEDVDSNIVEAIEPEIRFNDFVDNVNSFAREGAATIVIEYEQGSDMQKALSDVESAVARLTTLPEESEEPIISRIVTYDPVTRIVIAGPFSEAALKSYAKTVRDDLLDAGVDRVTFFGARDEELIVEILPETLRRLGLSLPEVAARIRESSLDLPSGSLEGAIAKQVRSLGEAETAEELGTIELRSTGAGQRVLLRDVAAIADGFDDDQPIGRWNGFPAIELLVSRSPQADALEVEALVDDYLTGQQATFPPTLTVQRYDVFANLIRDRIDLLIENGLTGLVLVLAVLILFLDVRLAFWVAVGIPIAMFTALAFMDFGGQSINMISLFGIIMTLGIVVDDAIVVGEHAHTLAQRGHSAFEASEQAALRMLAPVTAASLTTVAGFAPILLISGPIGDIMAAIPYVAIAVLLASLVECFLILPTHLRESVSAKAGPAPDRRLWPPPGPPIAWPVTQIVVVLRSAILGIKLIAWSVETSAQRIRPWFDPKFDAFRDRLFSHWVDRAVRWRYATLAGALAMFMVSIGLVAGGRVGFTFFPTPESDIVEANFSFVPGTSRATVTEMIDELDRAARAVEADAGLPPGGLIVQILGKVGTSQGSQFSTRTDDHLGGMVVELVTADRRQVRTAAFLDAWQVEVRPLPGIEQLTLKPRSGGPPGREIDIELTGTDLRALDAAAAETVALLQRFDGISAVDDDLRQGKSELILEVTSQGSALGFTTADVADQVRAAFDGAVARRFARGDEEVLVRVRHPKDAITEADLFELYLKSAQGVLVPLSQVVSVREDVGFARIQRQDGQRKVSVTGEVDENVTSSGEVLTAIDDGAMQEIATRHGIDYQFRGKAEEQAETEADMRVGALLGLTGMYLILAWVFSSYSRPFVVMAIIPFGLVGAIVGHWLLGYDLTFLSQVALLGLAGILVNDSIILVSTIDERLEGGEALHPALVGGAGERLRPVMLTSLTTIGGLLPLLFETSLQAQFLIPMGITLVFGLAIATFLVLFLVPCLVAINEDLRVLIGARSQYAVLNAHPGYEETAEPAGAGPSDDGPTRRA